MAIPLADGFLRPDHSMADAQYLFQKVSAVFRSGKGGLFSTRCLGNGGINDEALRKRSGHILLFNKLALFGGVEIATFCFEANFGEIFRPIFTEGTCLIQVCASNFSYPIVFSANEPM